LELPNFLEIMKTSPILIGLLERSKYLSFWSIQLETSTNKWKKKL